MKTKNINQKVIDNVRYHIERLMYSDLGIKQKFGIASKQLHRIRDNEWDYKKFKESYKRNQ